jgi:drug/metabolite transporter (DMT)-like permease
LIGRFSLVDSRFYLVLGSVLGAAGQVLLKVGVTGATTLAGFINLRVIAGLACYVVGTVLWLIALSRMPLSRVYPFTILTFVIVYFAALTLLGERLTAPLFAGVILVLCGLVIIASS